MLDNSGVKWVKLIHRYGRANFAALGELLLVSCRIVNVKKKWKKGQKLKCVLVHMTRPFFRTCVGIRCYENAVVVLKDNMDIKATRVKGVIFREFRLTKFRKLYTLGDYVL